MKDWSPRTQNMTTNKRAQHFLKGNDLNNLGMYVFPAWHSNIKVGDYLYLTEPHIFVTKSSLSEGYSRTIPFGRRLNAQPVR